MNAAVEPRRAPFDSTLLAALVGLLVIGAIMVGSASISIADRQTGDLADMIWNVPDTIAYLSQFVALAPGDLIFTGTPEGVGPVNRGDRLHGHVDGLADLTFTVA